MKSTEILLNIINTIYIFCVAIPSNENFNYVLSQLYTQREPFISVHEKLCSPREFYCMKKNVVFNQLPLWILCASRMNQVASQAAQAL